MSSQLTMRKRGRALELAIAGGYYMSPEVRTAIGYPGQIAQVVSPDIYPNYVEEGLLEFVFQVGIK